MSKKDDLEQYFHQPGLSNVLKRGMSATACCNIKTALSSLGYKREWHCAELYDEELESVVRTFQQKHHHPNIDGWVGPGTRRLLVRELEKIGFEFQRLLKIFEYDVALSFAGENRNYADELAQVLNKKKIRVFYDSYEEADLWGKNLFEHLEDVYGRRARFCVMFASSAYAEKAWPTHERRSAQQRALQEVSDEYILPIRIDNTKIPGLPTTVGYISIEKGIEAISDLLQNKMQKDREKTVSLWSHAHSNRFG